MIDFALVLKADGNPATGKTPSIDVSIDGAALASGGGSPPSDQGAGVYRYIPDSTEEAAQTLAIRISETDSLTQLVNYKSIIKNTTNNHIAAQLTNASSGDPVTTGITVTVSTGGAYGTADGTLTHLGDGTWSYEPTQAEANNDDLKILFSGNGSIIQIINVKTVTPVDLPAPKDVRKGIEYDNGNLTGNLVLPAETEVLAGVDFGNDDPTPEFTGNRTDCPANSALSTQSYGANGTSITGNYVGPNRADVRDGVSFGVLDMGQLDLPATTDVMLGVTYDSMTKVGDVVLPAVEDVKDGVGYGSGGTEFTGTFAGVTPRYPTEEQVIIDVIFGDEPTPQYTGNWDDTNLTPENVKVGVTYGPNGSLVGTLQPGPSIPELEGVPTAVRRVKTKDIEVETHRPDLVLDAQIRAQTPPATFCELDGCYVTPSPQRPGDTYRYHKCTCGKCTCGNAR